MDPPWRTSADRLLSREDLAAIVMTAVATNGVGAPGMTAAGARRESRARDGKVGPTPVAPRFGDAFLWKGHYGWGV
jgi:hypothetical protein